MFSSRTSWDVSPNPLAAALSRRQAAGAPTLDLTESNPTRAGVTIPLETLHRALADPRAGLYEPDPLGIPAARQAIGRYYADRGIEAPPERIVVTASTSEAYSFLFKLLANPGDEVLVPAPSYPLFEFLAGLESVRTVGYPLRYDGEWHIDSDCLEQALSPRTRAIVAVSPNNPTGSYLKRGELELLTRVCQERGLALLCDEVFADFPLEPAREQVASVIGAPGLLSFALSGASKIAALPQLKVGWLVASGPEPELSGALKRLEIISDTWLSASTPAQLALGTVLAERHLAQAPLLERLRENLATLKAACGPTAPWSPLKVEGGWSAVLRVPSARSELEWALALLEQEGVLVHPGFFFDFPSGAYLSVSLLCRPEVFREGIGRLARLIERG
jgi:aspartate/methionine/tyrosine aminotransferase